MCGLSLPEGRIVTATAEPLWRTLRRQAQTEAWALRLPPDGPASGWHHHARCTNQPTDLFYSAAGQPAALALCAECPVRWQCRQAAHVEEHRTQLDHIFGVRGGWPAAWRKAFYRTYKHLYQPRLRKTAECGTDSGYHAHRYRKEDACGACKAAHSEAVEARRKRAQLRAVS